MSNKSSLKDSLTGTFHTVEDRVEKVLYEKWHIKLHRHARHHIHKMRKRPDHHKDIISFLVAFFATSLVFVGWYFISLPKILQSYEISKKETALIGDPSYSLNRLKNTVSNIKEGGTGIQVQE